VFEFQNICKQLGLAHSLAIRKRSGGNSEEWSESFDGRSVFICPAAVSSSCLQTRCIVYGQLKVEGKTRTGTWNTINGDDVEEALWQENLFVNVGCWGNDHLVNMAISWGQLAAFSQPQNAENRQNSQPVSQSALCGTHSARSNNLLVNSRSARPNRSIFDVSMRPFLMFLATFRGLFQRQYI